MQPIHITQEARTEVQKQLLEYEKETGLLGYIELSIRHRGCSGLSYEMQFIVKPQEKDYTIEDERLCLKSDSLMWLLGTVIDYEDEGVSAGFIFESPHQKGKCHCGQAFYI